MRWQSSKDEGNIIQSPSGAFLSAVFGCDRIQPLYQTAEKQQIHLKFREVTYTKVDLSQHKDELLPYDLPRKKRIHLSGFDRNPIRHTSLVYYFQHCRQVKHPSDSQKSVESRFCSVEDHYQYSICSLEIKLIELA